MAEAAQSGSAARARLRTTPRVADPRVLESLGARTVAVDDAAYPQGLRDLDDRPDRIYVRGAIPERQRAIAVVGSRAASPYGLEQAARMGADLAGLGFAVVSGLARGIDAAAHRGALEAGGATVAVLPGGLDAVTPRHHRDLAETIAARGALVTEIPSGEPTAGMFIRRNRLIAALAAATVVVEAAERSGALSTARAARRLGRPLLAVPGDVDRETARGCHALIKSGARLAESAGDVFTAVSSVEPEALPATPEVRLLRALDATARDVESVARAASLPIDHALALLLRLEWQGLAIRAPGQRWTRAEDATR